MHFCGSVITHYDTFILRLQSIVGSPRGECGSCGSLAAFFGLQVIPTASKCGVTGVLFATLFASIPSPTGRENPPDSPGLNHLQICGFFDGDGGCGGRMLPPNLPCLPATGACHAPVQANREKIDFHANFIREISTKVNTCYQRKSGNTPRRSRYSCRACSRSSALGAVLYLAYSSCLTRASSFCSNPCRISFLKYPQIDMDIAFDHKDETPSYKIVKTV